MDRMHQAMERVKILVGMDVDEEDVVEEESSLSFMDDFNPNCTLSRQQRLYGFATCLVAGLACTLLSMLVFFQSNQVWDYIHVWQSAFTWEMLKLESFLWQHSLPNRPKMMLDPVRIYATAIYLLSIIIALFCALYVHNKLLTLLAIMLEFGALVWYSLSYIPFARTMVSKTMTACFDTEF